MRLPTRFQSDLWRRLAEAQDVAVADDRVLLQAEREVAARVGVPSQGPRRPRRGRMWGFALAGSLACVAGGVLLVSNTALDPISLLPVSLRPADQSFQRAFVADARSDLPLQFADGSAVVFRAGSAGRMQRLTSVGAEIVLERGWLEARVVHADSTLWLVHAGPYRVRVTGTHFAMTWAAASADVELQVDLYEGSVVIDGSVLGAGVALRAGQRLKIAAGVVLVEPLAEDRRTLSLAANGPRAASSNSSPAAALGNAASGATVSPALAPAIEPVVATRGVTAAPSAASVEAATGDSMAPAAAIDAVAPGGESTTAVRSRKSGLGARGVSGGAAPRAWGRSPYRSLHDDRWLALAERGDYRGALAVAKGLGWGALCRRLDAQRLLTLGDVARYSGAHGRAKQAFEALVRRFPEDRLAADAVFSLGRLAFESSRPTEATRWFRRYVTDWPDAPLADQAAGRVLECAVRMDNRQTARTAARRYLARAPGGPHATLAREVLDRPVDGPP